MHNHATHRHSHHRRQPKLLSLDRKFDPERYYSDDIGLDNVESLMDEWVYLGCPFSPFCELHRQFPAHDDCIVIAVDGACWNNGGPNASAAIGVFVGPGNKHNISRTVDFDVPTNQKAELTAGLNGLITALNLRKESRNADNRVSIVVIKSDSEYLVKAMTEWILKWKRNGYTNCKGRPVANKSIFLAIEEEFCALEQRGVEVLFWHVPREYNAEADELASRALQNAA
ncbi:ribonuclease H [Emydomyces testavorans]|uniref:ribonuclease H n=1 Tax=Emydomyces testavorans TaxID=2070801 RepID=A0AAF0IH69_9EURO|nr:ribonuclease H [Emydomyces testavorans]